MNWGRIVGDFPGWAVAALVGTWKCPPATEPPTRRAGQLAAAAPGSEARVDRLRLEREDTEDAFVYAPQRLIARDPIQCLQAEYVFTQRQGASDSRLAHRARTS